MLFYDSCVAFSSFLLAYSHNGEIGVTNLNTKVNVNAPLVLRNLLYMLASPKYHL